MNYLIGINNCKPSFEFIRNCIPLVSEGDRVFSTGVTTGDDVIAEYCLQEGIEFDALWQPDYGLRGNSADIYVFKKLALKSDSAFLFYKRKDKDIQEMIEVLTDLDLEFQEFQIQEN